MHGAQIRQSPRPQARGRRWKPRGRRAPALAGVILLVILGLYAIMRPRGVPQEA